MSRMGLLHDETYRDHGLLFARVGLGVMFIAHGWPKLVGGPEQWEKVGGAMASLGLDFAPMFWGFAGAGAEVFGGLLLALGLLTRPALFFLICTMTVAAIKHIEAGDGFKGYSHAVEAGIMFIGLFLIGPGKFSLDKKLFG